MSTFAPYELFPHFTAELLDGAPLLTLMSEAGHVPVGGPRQVQAVAATADLAATPEVEPGDPLLLLEVVTQDATGRGLEWFSVWHRTNTVFDELRRLRSMAREIEQSLAGFAELAERTSDTVEDGAAPPS